MLPLVKEFISIWILKIGLEVSWIHKIIAKKWNEDKLLKFSESTKEPLRIGSSKLDMNSSFDGKISCIQYFKEALNPSQIHHFMDCDKVEVFMASKCPKNFYYIDGLCYYFHTVPMQFQEAEHFCMSILNEVGWILIFL